MIMNIEDFPNINYAWSGLIVEELVRNGVTCFCIAPGSRSSPLAVAAARNKKAETIIHYDERGLAFYALGYVSVTKHPAVLICSSGTAAANFFPAVIECAKKKLPLIVLTADRPPELRDTGALQAIDQIKIYGNYTRWFTDLPTPGTEIKPQFLLTTIDQAVFRAKTPMGGPVHINCMFREPLAPTKTPFDAHAYLAPIKNWFSKNGVYTRYTTGENSTDIWGDRLAALICGNETGKTIGQTTGKRKRGIIVVGKLANREEGEAVLKLSEILGWPIFPDIVSGLRFTQHKNIIHYYDLILLCETWQERFPVDTILHLGGRITSKRWYGFIEKYPPQNYIMVLSHWLRNDPLHCVTERVKSTVGDFVRTILSSGYLKGLEKTGEDNEFLMFLCQASVKTEEVVESVMGDGADALGDARLNELSVARLLSKEMRENHGLFLSNSMPVRDMDMGAAVTGKHPLIGSNRGASGIDGIVATACGFARAAGTGVTLLIGDLAFLHDLNSLVLTKTLKEPLIIVTINNDGGGIFSFLPIARTPGIEDVFDTCFGTPHGLRFEEAARMFGLDYATPATIGELKDTYQNALTKKKSTIIEIESNRESNEKNHTNLQKSIKNTLQNMLKY